MTDRIEDRVLRLAEKAEAYMSEHSWGGDTDEDGAKVGYEFDHDGPCAYEELLDAMAGDQDPAKNRSAEVVAAMCRVVAAAREDLLECHVCYCDEAWRGRGLHAPECKFDEVDDLRAALAALDAMEAE